MRVISWAIISCSILALYLGGIRPLALQLGIASDEPWTSMEIDRKQSLGAMVPPSNGEQQPCQQLAAGATEQHAPAREPGDVDLCVESAVARH